MSKVNGDRSRHNRQRVKKLKRRVEMRALREAMKAAPAAAAAPKTNTPQGS